MKKTLVTLTLVAFFGATMFSSCKNKGGTRSGGGGKPINTYKTAEKAVFPS